MYPLEQVHLVLKMAATIMIIHLLSCACFANYYTPNLNPTEQVPLGLDLAVMKMKKMEVAEVTVAPQYGYGKGETKLEAGVVPPNSVLVYDIELVDFVKVERGVIKCRGSEGVN